MGCVFMATKSILKSIVIKDKKTSSQLSQALQCASDNPTPKVGYSKTFTNINRSQVKELLGDKL